MLNQVSSAVPVIEIENLTKEYKSFQAVKGISFQVMKGEVFGILGPNGAGKTTTLEIIEGLKKQTSGRCRVLGFDNLKESNQVKKRIGVQLQSSEYFDYLNISELLVLFASLYGHSIDPLELLKKVNLVDKAQNRVKELSGGQKQRFMIASAMAHKPEVIFLDEPTTGLDPQARRDLWNLIKELNSQDTTIVLTTHYMEEAEYLCDRVAIMDSGKVLRIDPPQKLIEEVSKYYRLSFFTTQKLQKEFFTSIPQVKEVYFEQPKIIIELEDIKAFKEVVEKLQRERVEYSFLTLKSATLEDVYLQLTGKEFKE
jgi:ABC-2 type transport system ATP-binding protein